MRSSRTVPAQFEGWGVRGVMKVLGLMAGSTGFEPATSGLTVQCANQAAPRPRQG